MSNVRLHLQPSIKQLLAAEALGEAQVLAAFEQVDSDKQVSQVVYGFSSARAGSLVVARLENVYNQIENPIVKELAGVIAIGQGTALSSSSVVEDAGAVAQRTLAAPEVSVDVDQLATIFADLGVPLILVPGLGEPAQVAEEIRLAFQSELKRASSRLHAHFLATVIESGMSGLAEELSRLVQRPVSVENSEFKVLASENMGPTPPGQQKTLTEEVAADLHREMRALLNGNNTLVPEEPVRIGRRLVTPLVLEGVVVGYVSVMVRPSDDLQAISEYMTAAALAALVDFSNRRKEVSTFYVTQKSLLKDLLSGRSLSAGDQERLEQHYGFDLCDGFFVLVVQVLPPHRPASVKWPQQENIAVVEMEPARVFVFPYHERMPKTWQQMADELLNTLKQNMPDLKLQIGASRMATSLLDLPDAYREARQALLISQMSAEDAEFCVGYGDLGIKRLLYLMIDHPELERFYEDNLAQLEAYDEEWETELVPTLRVYLEQGANLNSAAKELFVHRHTMRYRLEQIAELLKVDIDSSEVLLNLQIAFLIRDMIRKPRA